MTTKFWIVMGELGRQSYRPYFRHPSEAAAFTESERLARAFPGLKFFVMESKGASLTSDTITLRFGSNDSIAF